MITEKIILNEKRNVFLTTYIQETEEVPERPALLVLPGGGYHICAPREGEAVALAFARYGYNGFVLHYSVDDQERMPGNQDWPNPLDDFEQAMEYLSANAASLRIDPEMIAIAGFSAGGHLACAAAVSAVHRPAAAILGYPVTGYDGREVYGKFNTVEHVTEDTCPCFIFAASTDPVVNIMNSIKFMEALAENGVPFESHIYGKGPHAFSTCDPAFQVTGACPRIADWVEDSAQWLSEVMKKRHR